MHIELSHIDDIGKLGMQCYSPDNSEKRRVDRAKNILESTCSCMQKFTHSPCVLRRRFITGALSANESIMYPVDEVMDETWTNLVRTLEGNLDAKFVRECYNEAPNNIRAKRNIVEIELLVSGHELVLHEGTCRPPKSIPDHHAALSQGIFDTSSCVVFLGPHNRSQKLSVSTNSTVTPLKPRTSCRINPKPSLNLSEHVSADFLVLSPASNGDSNSNQSRSVPTRSSSYQDKLPEHLAGLPVHWHTELRQQGYDHIHMQNDHSSPLAKELMEMSAGPEPVPTVFAVQSESGGSSDQETLFDPRCEGETKSFTQCVTRNKVGSNVGCHSYLHSHRVPGEVYLNLIGSNIQNISHMIMLSIKKNVMHRVYESPRATC